MRLLHLVSTDPRTSFGHAAIRAKELAREWLKQGHEVVTFYPSNVTSHIEDEELGTLVTQNLQGFPRSFPEKLLTRPLPYQLRMFSREYISHSIRELERHGPYDAIIADELTMGAWCIEARSLKAPLIYVAHNYEFDLYLQINGQSIFNKLAATFLRSLERKVIHQADIVFAFSGLDREKLIKAYGRKDLLVTSAGVASRLAAPQNSERHGMIFIGALDYAPNIEGLQWFVENVYPHVRTLAPLTIAGRRPNTRLKNLCESAKIELIDSPAEVESLRRTARIEIVPLFKGSGTRGKIIEAFASGLCVVSTSLGAEGLGLTPGQEYIAAGCANDWTQALKDLLQNPSKCHQIATTGWRVSESFLYSHVARHLLTPLSRANAA